MNGYIFDMDGTLTDTEILWIPATVAYLKTLGINAPADWALKTVYGRSWNSIYSDIVEAYPQLAGIPSGDMSLQLSPFFQRECAAGDIRVPGSLETLQRLAKDSPCCIVSGSPRAEIQAIVDRFELTPYLKFFLGAEDVPRGKPDPIGFLMAAERMGIPPEDCVVFEDSSVGIRAARSAGMGAVAIVLQDHPLQDLSMAHITLGDLRSFNIDDLRKILSAGK